jgi:hypothetical protein
MLHIGMHITYLQQNSGDCLIMQIMLIVFNFLAQFKLDFRNE